MLTVEFLSVSGWLPEDEAADTAAGDDTDVQLERACDMLRGILALQGR